MGVIEVRDLEKAFDGSPVLRGITFTVQEGEIFGFLGPNGAGKTTTMRCLLGLLVPDSGEALVLGSELGINDSLRQEVGVLLENNGLYPALSARENLEYYAGLYGVENRDERIRHLLSLIGLSDKADEKVGNFSTGMGRKLGIARAILHEPDVLFLDEPASGLDPEAQRMVRDLILRLSETESMTVFLNSHNLDEVQRICSHVAILNEGRIEAFDSVEKLRKGTDQATAVFTLSDPGQTGAACSLLMAEGIEARTEAGGRVVAVLPEKSAAPVLKILVSGGIAVEEARHLSRSLEDIYLEIMHKGGES